MKTIHLRITLVLALIGASVPVLADSGHEQHEGHAGHEHHGHVALSEKTIDELFLQMDESMKSIADAISRKELSGIHDFSSDLSAAAKEIPSRVDPEKRKRVEGASRNVAALADELHVAADRKEKAQVEASFKKLERLVPLLKGQTR